MADAITICPVLVSTAMIDQVASAWELTASNRAILERILFISGPRCSHSPETTSGREDNMEREHGSTEAAYNGARQDFTEATSPIHRATVRQIGQPFTAGEQATEYPQPVSAGFCSRAD